MRPLPPSLTRPLVTPTPAKPRQPRGKSHASLQGHNWPDWVADGAVRSYPVSTGFHTNRALGGSKSEKVAIGPRLYRLYQSGYILEAFFSYNLRNRLEIRALFAQAPTESAATYITIHFIGYNRFSPALYSEGPCCDERIIPSCAKTRPS